MSGLFDRWIASVQSTPRAESGDGTAVEPSQPALFDTGTAEAASRDAEPASAAEAPAPAVEQPPVAETASAGAVPESAAAKAPAAPARPARKPAPPVLDAVLAAAVDVAREAIAEAAGASEIGAHLGAVAEGTRLVTHSFECTTPAYRGWHWVAVLARAPRSKKATVCETALLPGADALLAPEWVPWENRVQPGDMGPKDVLPREEDDPNLDLGLEQVDAQPGDDIDQVPNFEFGLGRVRVLSREGIAKAAGRWERSDAGPEGEYAKKADAQCSTCGYLMPIAGSVRTRFGVCANAWSPFDGRVVALDAGCGAHSETDVARHRPAPSEAVLDEINEPLEMIETGAGSAQRD
ncbi:DUF3027 domain-containing protein [Brevibacterium album]|uniref:DUF3027 domain-containing protein n=1 Tax=Brevibacterium album TaxID=417948 RepID=UPI0004128EC3|nr:DUF3027 domain-containing protein [Brevibacterium album]